MEYVQKQILLWFLYIICYKRISSCIQRMNTCNSYVSPYMQHFTLDTETYMCHISMWASVVQVLCWIKCVHIWLASLCGSGSDPLLYIKAFQHVSLPTRSACRNSAHDILEEERARGLKTTVWFKYQHFWQHYRKLIRRSMFPSAPWHSVVRWKGIGGHIKVCWFAAAS